MQRRKERVPLNMQRPMRGKKLEILIWLNKSLNHARHFPVKQGKVCTEAS